MKIASRIIFALALTLSASQFAVAACDLEKLQQQIPTLGYDTVLKSLKDRSCLGDPKADTDRVVKRIEDLTPDTKDAIARFEALVAALNALIDFSGEHVALGVQRTNWLALSRELQESNRRLATLNKNTSANDAQALAEQALPQKWDRIESNTQGEIEINGIKVRLLLPTECDSKAACPAFESQRDMIRVVNLLARLRGYSQNGSLMAHYADAQLQTARWNAYRSQGQHQYIWEVWLNGLNMGDDLCPKDSGTGIQRGFCAVPKSQWILLHPDVGLRADHYAQQSSDLKAAFIVEVLGYYRWDWDKARPTEMTNRYGISVIAAYANTPSGTKWGYGPMLHVGSGYNFAVTYSAGHTWSAVVSLNLAERYFGRKEELVGYLKQIEKPNFLQLLQN